jgi:hypothetical protein
MKWLVIGLMLAASTAHADSLVIGGEVSGLAWNDYGGGVGQGAYAHAGVRFGRESWVEPDIMLRLAEFGTYHHMVEPMVGLRAGTTSGELRPWIGGYVGHANHWILGGDGDDHTYNGTALEAALGCDITLSGATSLVLRLDLNQDFTDPSYGSATWLAGSIGVEWEI